MLIAGFHISTMIFVSGLATLAFLFVTKGKIPLYFGSSFSYIAAGLIVSRFGMEVIEKVLSATVTGSIAMVIGISLAGVAIMINKKVDLFDARNLAVIAVILVVGLGGSYGFPNGMIPIFGKQLPAIATTAIVGIILNLFLSIGRKKA